jgi:CBS domain-containing membrane protein
MWEELKYRLEEVGPEHVVGLMKRLRLHWLLRHFPHVFIWAAYVFVNGFASIVLLSLLAVVTKTAFVFPSLGPTAYLFFFAPMGDSSSPRNAILGHAIGLVCGYGAFRFAGLHYGAAGVHGVLLSEALAAALSLAFTGALMVLFRVNHPPAGATTLIVSLGILSTPYDLAIIEVAVVLLTVQAWVFNRLAGVPYPFWHHGRVRGR